MLDRVYEYICIYREREDMAERKEEGRSIPVVGLAGMALLSNYFTFCLGRRGGNPFPVPPQGMGR